MKIRTLTMTRKEFKEYKVTHKAGDYDYYYYLDHRHHRVYVVYEAT